MKIGIDLVWVKHQKCGGVESYIRNLMNGFAKYDKRNEYVLFAARDNYDSFLEYDKYSNMVVRKCTAISEKPLLRYIWENLHMDYLAKKEKVDVMFIPVYSKPWTYGRKIPYVTVIHDLQTLHYPEYFSKLMNIFMRYIWPYAIKTSDSIVTISQYGKADLISYYPYAEGKTVTIYNPIITNKTSIPFSEISEKFTRGGYALQSGGYYYCVSAMLPHKNLNTILGVIAGLKERGERLPLVISGIGVGTKEFEKKCTELGINDLVINTGFVSDAERDCLYDNCSAFLFPSIFEGFGMPPIEAMRRGKFVVTTRKTCLEEVTEGKAVYVDDPLNVDEWVEKLLSIKGKTPSVYKFEKYDLENVTNEYVRLLEAQLNKKGGCRL